MSGKVSIFWLRRDLRLQDNAGLYYALKAGIPVVPVFVFDTAILDGLDKSDKRVSFIHDALTSMQEQLLELGSSLQIIYDTPEGAFSQLLKVYAIDSVYTNGDYEPYAVQRDERIRMLLLDHKIPFHSFKDQVIFEKLEIAKDNGSPYTVFTPYSRRWKEQLNDFATKPYLVKLYEHNFYKQQPRPIPSLKTMGFEPVVYSTGMPKLDRSIATGYDKTRDFPARCGTTRLSVHLRFGTISIRQLVADVLQLNTILLNELIWREFYQMILFNFPHVLDHSFKKEYDSITWRNNDEEFEKWCEGKTGYPIVDAGMRELNETGFMHNRVRMITASFLTKHLLIDWRWGEAYFGAKLLDYDLAANNGGWQWAAGSGCDAAPYFRIFNPYLQTEKFDPNHEYIKKWVPEYNTPGYPNPIVDHKIARERCLKAYKEALHS